MKKVMVIIRPQAHQRTKEAMERAGFVACSSVSVCGRGRLPVKLDAADDSAGAADAGHRMVPKKLILVYIRDEDEEKLVQAVLSVNRTGNAGDGKIFVQPVRQGIRIRTGQAGEDALV